MVQTYSNNINILNNIYSFFFPIVVKEKCIQNDYALGIRTHSQAFCSSKLQYTQHPQSLVLQWWLFTCERSGVCSLKPEVPKATQATLEADLDVFGLIDFNGNSWKHSNWACSNIFAGVSQAFWAYNIWISLPSAFHWLKQKCLKLEYACKMLEIYELQAHIGTQKLIETPN